MFERLIQQGYQVIALHHASAILTMDMPEAIEDIQNVCLDLQLPVLEMVKGGGGEAAITQRIRHTFHEKYGWKKHNYEIKKIIDGIEKEAITHEVDHIKVFKNGTIAIEVEWNNKDPFFDRDLENFKTLHAEGVISVGIIITRGASLQNNLKSIIERFAEQNGITELDDLIPYYKITDRQRDNINKATLSTGSFVKGWANSFVSDKYGESTTHWRKLTERVDRGVGNPCPMVLIGLPDAIVVF
jgi:hypothetical protein